MTDPAAVRREAHPLCREWLRLNGRPYPRSSCQECGTLIRHNFRCAHALDEAATRPAEAMGDAERVTELRNDQAARVMPLIGPLLDALDGLSNDAKESLRNEYFGVYQSLRAVQDAMEES